MTAVPVAEASDVLAILAAAAEDETWDANKNLVDELDQRTSTERINDLLRKADRANPVGVFVGSTVRAQEYISDLEDAPVIKDWPQVWKTLKTAGRIVQAGRGRGKLLVVIDDTTIGNHEEPRAKLPTATRTTKATGARKRGRPAKATKATKKTPAKKAARGRGRPPKPRTAAELAQVPRAGVRPTEQFATAFMALLEVAMTPLRDELAELRHELDAVSEAISTSATSDWS